MILSSLVRAPGNASSAIGIRTLIQKWWFYVDQTHVCKDNVRLVCTRAQFRGQVRLIDSRRAKIKARSIKQIAFYPHGTLVHFGWKKVVAQCCGHASPHRTRHWQGVPGAHFSTDQGGSFLCLRLKPISKFTNSSIRGGPSGVPEAHPQKDRL